MVPEGQFHAAVNSSESLLNKLELLRERNSYYRSRLGAAELSGVDYVSMWEKLISANDYDFRLVDDSLMLFWRSEDGGELRYCWFESPRSVPPFGEYARSYIGEILGGATDDWAELEQLLGDCEGEILDAFEEERRAAPLRDAVTPLRYEYSTREYKEGIHPASHLHIGISNEIRLACRRVLTPLSFVLLVLRQSYPGVWMEILRNGAVLGHSSHVRDGLAVVARDYWGKGDEFELWLE